MSYRNKTYICFDGDKDMPYYRLMTAWKENKNFDVDFYNAHDLNSARDDSQEESIKRQLRERFANSKLLIVLIGESTKFLSKFVKWEMEVALKLDLPIVGVNLNGSRQRDGRCPPTIEDQLAIFIPFGDKIIKCAMDGWPNDHASHSKNNVKASYRYLESVYEKLGLNK